MSSLFVFKLGGSSVSSIGSLHHFSVRLEQVRQHAALVVVSALSKVTDQLEQYTRAILECRQEDGDAILQSLRVRHLQMIGQLLTADDAPEVAQTVRQLLDDLAQVRSQEAVNPAVLRDRILPFGEAMSSTIVSAYLARQHGHGEKIDARQLLVTDDCFGTAEPLDHPTRKRLETHLRPKLVAGSIFVTQGFCGSTADGRVTTLGRGGSDFSATYLGALLGAKEIEIRTDTPGVLSADPRKIIGTRTLRKISHQRASTLAHFGAKVLHQRCIEPVIGSDIPVRVLSSFNPEEPGTLIGQEDEEGGFSVTHCRGWMHYLVRPAQMDLEEWRKEASDLLQHQSLLSLVHDDSEARLVCTSSPEDAPLSQALSPASSAWETSLLFIMSSRLDRELLEEVSAQLRDHEIVVSASFIDRARGGMILAVAEDFALRACILAHRTLLRALKPALAH